MTKNQSLGDTKTILRNLLNAESTYLFGLMFITKAFTHFNGSMVMNKNNKINHI